MKRDRYGISLKAHNIFCALKFNDEPEFKPDHGNKVTVNMGIFTMLFWVFFILSWTVTDCNKDFTLSLL